MRDHLSAFFLAWQFLTRVPIPAVVEFNQHRNRLATGYYPLVGALLGLTAGAVWWISLPVFGHQLAVLLSMVTTIALTGAFHEDGLADTFDSFGSNNAADALGIMRDSRLGTFGVCALICLLALKAFALMQTSSTHLIYLLVFAHATSRFSSMVVVKTSRYARESGMAKPVAEEIPASSMAIMLATLTIIAATGAYLYTLWLISALLLAAAIGHLVSRLCYERRLSGYTGDCLGATQQLTELCIYLGAVACQ